MFLVQGYLRLQNTLSSKRVFECLLSLEKELLLRMAVINRIENVEVQYHLDFVYQRHPPINLAARDHTTFRISKFVPLL